VNARDENIIVLDDVTSIRQRIISAIVLVVIVATLAFSVTTLSGSDAASEVTPTVSAGQSVESMCGAWDVPELLQPVANAAYPSWNWVCRLIQD
jgi:hypothetical protein